MGSKDCSFVGNWEEASALEFLHSASLSFSFSEERSQSFSFFGFFGKAKDWDCGGRRLVTRNTTTGTCSRAGSFID